MGWLISVEIMIVMVIIIMNNTIVQILFVLLLYADFFQNHFFVVHHERLAQLSAHLACSELLPAIFKTGSLSSEYLRNRFSLAVICCLIYYWLEVSR